MKEIKKSHKTGYWLTKLYIIQTAYLVKNLFSTFSVVSRIEWRSATVASLRCMASDSVDSTLVTSLRKCRYKTMSFFSSCPR